MKRSIVHCQTLLIFLLSFPLIKAQGQTTDTLVTVGPHKIHFNITKGKGIPILFEAGAGNDGSVWNDVLKPIATITEAPLITYDRIGQGKSSHDTSWRSIATATDILAAGLQQLGYNGDLMWVAHSRGALYATTYANKHPEKVKMAVLIDGASACSCQLGFIIVKNADTALKSLPFPHSVAVIDLVAEHSPFENRPGKGSWKDCHDKFVAEAPNRIGITAYGCGHYIFQDNPALAINVIAEAYSKVVSKDRAADIARRGLRYAVEGANQLKKQDADHQHSEEELNNWGYSLDGEGKAQEALNVFQLNVILYPLSWNVYDSYGEALLKAGKKAEAIKMYQKSVELNPKNDNAVTILKQLSN